jgi:hypothetical protein
MAMRQTKKRSGRAKRRSGGNLVPIGVLAAVVVFVGAVSGILLTSGGGDSTRAAGSGSNAVPVAASALEPTGEVSSMGVPVVETPGYASGVARIGGIAVQGANWELGQVPLDVAVRPFWTLTNTGNTDVTLGDPQAEVRQGCCPGPFVLGSSTLAPGDSTVLTFELSMHEGMDGWHDMGVYVPVTGAGGDEWLELNVTGDFRN